MLRGVLATTVLAAAVMFTGCESTDEAATQPDDDGSMGMVNSACPISGKGVNPDSTVTYEGATVGLCCDDCLGAWNKMSEDEKGKFVASAEN